jgi:hypothetical protein
MQPQHRQKMKPHKLERLYRQTVNYEVALINVQEMRQKGAFFAFAFLFVIPSINRKALSRAKKCVDLRQADRVSQVFGDQASRESCANHFGGV